MLNTYLSEIEKEYEEKLRWIPVKYSDIPEKVQLEFKNSNTGFVNICAVQEIEGKLCICASLGYGLLSDSEFTHYRFVL